MVTQLPTPGGEPPVVTNGPLGGDLWISKDSDYVEEASRLIQLFTTKEFQIGQAEAVDAGPANLAAVAESNAHPTFKQCCRWYESFSKLGPSAVVRNPEVARVNAKMKAVKPDLGAIVQGAFSGDVADVRAELTKLSDASEKAREAAIKATGDSVAADAWAFPDWRHGEDYVAG
ncbi:hypothetical protein ACQBAU_11260 [Propionibacteriaceae bacterium Y2011]